jgi:hypothetical protein
MQMGMDEEGPVFPGSQGAASVIAWIDRVLEDLRDGRVNDARAMLEGEAWRSLNLDGIPVPIRNQLHESLEHAADVLTHADASPETAEEALLVARSRFLPGA